MSTLTELKEVLAGLVPVVQAIAENQQRQQADIVRLTEELAAGNTNQAEVDEAVAAAQSLSDALKAIVDKHFATRQLSMDQARKIIDHEVQAFEGWLEGLTVQASIKDLYVLIQGYARDQARAMSASEEERARMEQMLLGALKRFLHRPVSFLREHPSLEHIDYTRRFFQLDEDYTDRHKG